MRGGISGRQTDCSYNGIIVIPMIEIKTQTIHPVHLVSDSRMQNAGNLGEFGKNEWINASSMRDANGAVFVIGHDAIRAGAQHVLLALLREWKRTRPFPFRLTLVDTGALRKQFEAVCPTLVLSDYPDATEREAALRAFLYPKPRLVYSNTVANGPLLESISWLNCPVITHVHELQKSIERWSPGQIIAATLRCSDHFIAVSEPVAGNLVARYGVDREAISIIEAFVDIGTESAERTNACLNELGLEDDKIVVFGCGTTDWRKGADLFVEIAAMVCAIESRLQFFWIGFTTREERRALEGRLHALDMQKRVCFLWERPDPRAYFPLGHVFLLSSREDPFPLVALEAADAGLPIVCFNEAGGMPGFVMNECGIVVPFEDVNAAANAVLKLAHNPDIRLSLGAKAKVKLASCHATPPAAARIADLVDRIFQTRTKAIPRPPDAAPLITTIVPVYNHARFLPERLASIEKQCIDEMEILLLDDASTDNSLAIMERFSESEPRARLMCNQQNSGSTFKQWKKALALARGRYIWIAESDDGAEPDMVRTLLGKLEASHALVLAYAQSRMVDEHGSDLGLPLQWTADISPDRWRADYVVDGLKEIMWSLSIKNTIPNASAVVFQNFPGIEELVDDSMHLCADWLFWIRLCARGSISYTARPLNLWRQRSSNARTVPPGELEWKEGQRIIKTAAQLCKVSIHEKRRWLTAFEKKCQTWLNGKNT